MPLVDVFTGRQPDHLDVLDEIIDLLSRHEKKVDVERVRGAYELAAQVHKEQKRKDGRPYIVHPLAVARTCAEHWMTDVAVAAALLHDTIEDADKELGLSEKVISDRFGPEVARIVAGVTKFEKHLAGEGDDTRAETLKKLLHATALEDIRIIILKIFDRHQNVQSLSVFREEKRRRIGEETMRFYVPMADRLGFYGVARDMEDSVLAALQPKRHKELKKWVDREKKKKAGSVTAIIADIERSLSDMGVNAADKFKAKGLFYINQMATDASGELDYRRMEEIAAFNITFIVPDTDACFRTLNLVHSKFTFLPKQVRDFINNPKLNGYQSIHTVVRDRTGSRITVIIRTSEMEWRNRQGVIADLRAGRVYEGTFLKDLVQSLDIINPSELLEMTGRLFYPEIDVTSPAGESFKLPEGSTALDFAYYIHTDVGDRAKAAVIGGRERKLDTMLRSGQQIEIRKAKEPQVKPVWLSWVRSDKAKLAIRKHLNHDEREAMAQETARFCAYLKQKIGIAVRPGGPQLAALRRKLAIESDERLAHDMFLGLVSYDHALMWMLPSLGKKDLVKVARSLAKDRIIGDDSLKELMAVPGDEDLAARLAGIVAESLDRAQQACYFVEVEGAHHPLHVRFANCCKPSYGDPVMALATRDKGLVVHKDTCSRVALSRQYDSVHLVKARWRQSPSTRRFLVQVEGDDRRNLLHDLTRVLAEFRINIVELSIRTIEENRFGGMILLEVSDLTEIDALVRKFNAVPALKVKESWVLP